jgi:NADH-quinone oxidoreductase subunit F
MAYGKQAARNIDLQLMEADRWSRILRDFEYSQTPPQEPSENPRHTGHMIPAKLRVRSQDEVETGLTREETFDEACRCLRCDVKVADVS